MATEVSDVVVADLADAVRLVFFMYHEVLPLRRRILLEIERSLRLHEFLVLNYELCFFVDRGFVEAELFVLYRLDISLVVIASMEKLDESVVRHVLLIVVETVSLLPDVVPSVLLVLLIERFLYNRRALCIRIQVLHIWEAHVASHLGPVVVLVEEALVHIVLGEKDAAILILGDLGVLLVVGMHVHTHFVKELSFLDVIEIVEVVSIGSRLVDCLEVAPLRGHLDKDLSVFVLSRAALLRLGHIVLNVLRRWLLGSIQIDLLKLDSSRAWRPLEPALLLFDLVNLHNLSKRHVARLRVVHYVILLHSNSMLVSDRLRLRYHLGLLSRVGERDHLFRNLLGAVLEHRCML